MVFIILITIINSVPATQLSSTGIRVSCRRKKAGFGVTEVLMVVAILGVNTALALPFLVGVFARKAVQQRPNSRIKRSPRLLLLPRRWGPWLLFRAAKEWLMPSPGHKALLESAFSKMPFSRLKCPLPSRMRSETRLFWWGAPCRMVNATWISNQKLAYLPVGGRGVGLLHWHRKIPFRQG